MAYTSHTLPPANASSSSSVFSLCPTATTLFFLPGAYALLFLAALPGNALSLWVFLRRIAAASPVHVYLSHLSVSNLTLALTAPFLAAYFARGSAWTRGGFLCRLLLHAVIPVFHISINVSMALLTLVALSRFATLVRPPRASEPSGRFFARLTRASFARRACATVWALAVGAVVPAAVIYSVSEAASGGAADGSAEVCYNPAVEIRGGVSAMVAVASVAVFSVFYLLVLLSHMAVWRRIRRSRRGTSVTTSQRLLGRVLRNIVVIQVVLSVCLLPYHIFKPFFIYVAVNQRQLVYSPGPDIWNRCHPLSTFVELKNCLLLLAVLRGATDPLMYYLLDKTFRHHALGLLRREQKHPRGRATSAVVGGDNRRTGHLEDGTVDLTRGSVLEP